MSRGQWVGGLPPAAATQATLSEQITNEGMSKKQHVNLQYVVESWSDLRCSARAM